MSSKRVRMLSVLKVLNEIDGINLVVRNQGHEVEITYDREHTLVKGFIGEWKFGNRWVFYPKYPNRRGAWPDAKHTLWTPYEVRDFTTMAECIITTHSRRRDPR